MRDGNQLTVCAMLNIEVGNSLRATAACIPVSVSLGRLSVLSVFLVAPPRERRDLSSHVSVHDKNVSEAQRPPPNYIHQKFHLRGPVEARPLTGGGGVATLPPLEPPLVLFTR